MKRDFPKEVFGLVIIGTLAAVAWWKAPQFDPKTMGFFTKNYVAPYPEMPRDFRLAGAAFAAIGGLIMLAGFKSVWRRHLTWRSAGPGLVGAALVILFGSAFFVAANSAERHIGQEQVREAG